MKSPRFGIRSIPYLFALITVGAYGLLIGQTGFYWDDWPFAWIAKFLGPQEFFRAFAGVRPFLEPIFFVTTSLIPPNPIYWQIFALVIRFISGWSAWFALRQVWPNHQRQASIASLLFLVFPGYSQHWVAFTHINQEWIPFIFYLLSFGFNARALRNPDAFSKNTLIALLLTVAGVFPTEYFIGLEPVRFFFIWVIVAEEGGTFMVRGMKTLKRWGPYLLVWLANAAWLAYFYTVGSYDSYAVTVVKKPLSIFGIVSEFLGAFWKAGFYIWGQIVVLIGKSITTPSSLLTIGLIVATFIFLLFYFKRLELSTTNTKAFALPALLLGITGILLGRIPSFAAGLPLTLQSSYDRFMISMMLASCLFITGLIELLIQNASIKTIVAALLIALGIGQQFFNANIFRRDWEKQQEILWQLSWRVPGLQPNTILITDELPLDYETDLSFTAPINWMYTSKYTQYNLPFGIIFLKIRLGSSLPALTPNTPISVGMRGASFDGSTSQALVLYMPNNGCLRILDPVFGDQYTYANLSQEMISAIPLSDPSQIIVDSNHTMGIPFLTEPKHQWCYYYTKAELARQKNDWKEIISLMDEAKASGYKPTDPFEWLPYIEAQVQTGDVNSAEKMSTELLKQEKKLRPGLCRVWKRVQAQVQAGSAAESQVHNILFQFACER
jgi:hypothetical protein